MRLLMVDRIIKMVNAPFETGVENIMNVGKAVVVDGLNGYILDIDLKAIECNLKILRKVNKP